MERRLFITTGLMLAGIGRRAWAQDVRYAPLVRPVAIPLEQVSTPWRPVFFKAEATGPAAPGAPGRRVLINGVVFRRSPAVEGRGGTPDDLSALCLTCPHEQCVVDLITDPSELVKMTGSSVHDPLFECGCHLSVFDARRDGERISGETPRGLYRFRISAIREGSIEIGEIEEEALSAV
jgi:Rieske Fe-S protein